MYADAMHTNDWSVAGEAYACVHVWSFMLVHELLDM